MSLLLNSMTIVEARDGGFMVIQDIDPGIRNHPLFAGPLDDCLAYMAKKLRRVDGGDHILGEAGR